MDNQISRRQFHSLVACAGLAYVLPESVGASEGGAAFIHPGLLHGKADLKRMREGVRSSKQPISAGFEKLREHPASKLSYVRAGASTEIGRNPNVRFGEFDRDANASYQCSLMWCLTGDRAYAHLAGSILDDWSATLRTITGLDAVLCASLGGFKMVNAAELLRHSESGWQGAERCGLMFRDVFLPVIKDFATFANGNWDTAAIKMMLAIAIYIDDHALFDRGTDYYLHGCGDGQLAHYIYENGQCQESGRDQQHTQLGLAHMGDACEMAWKQGLDLYGALDNRLLIGFEYTARYCLGQDVPFMPDIDRTGKYKHSVISARSALRPVYEQIYNHYVMRRGVAAPWTTRAAASVRPEGAPFQADATGYGTLLYSRDAGSKDAAVPDAQSVLFTRSVAQGIVVDFVPFATGAMFRVERSNAESGRFTTVSPLLRSGPWTDTAVRSGERYSYRLRKSLPKRQVAGLPTGWQGSEASFDGDTWEISGRVEHQGEGLIARIVPPIASTYIRFGILVDGREELVVTTNGGNPEHPGWVASVGPKSEPLPAAVLSYGRFAGPLWMRVNDAMGEISSDGKSWVHVGAVTPGTSVGIFVSNGPVHVDKVGVLPGNSSG